MAFTFSFFTLRHCFSRSPFATFSTNSTYRGRNVHIKSIYRKFFSILTIVFIIMFITTKRSNFYSALCTLYCFIATIAAAHLPHHFAANRPRTVAVFAPKMTVFAISSLICCHHPLWVSSFAENSRGYCSLSVSLCGKFLRQKSSPPMMTGKSATADATAVAAENCLSAFGLLTRDYGLKTIDYKPPLAR
jgi:hypothetical protein